MSTFEERIAKAVTDKLNDGTVEELVSDAVTKALKSSIEDQFNWKGEAKKIIDEKVKEVMTPVIERVNLDEYTVKLDAVLTEIINSTNLIDNKEILGNFKSLMTDPDKDTISLKEVESEEVIDSVIGWHYEVIPTDELSKCEPFCYSMPLTDTYIKLNEMEVVGNVFDNPELLKKAKGDK